MSVVAVLLVSFFFFFNDTATTEIYTLSLHDALPISASSAGRGRRCFSCTSPPHPTRHPRPGSHLRCRTRPPYPPRSLHVGARVDQHDADHPARGASHPACQTPTRDQPPSWRVPGGLLAARCPGLRRLAAGPTRVLAPAHE